MRKIILIAGTIFIIIIAIIGFIAELPLSKAKPTPTPILGTPTPISISGQNNFKRDPELDKTVDPQSKISISQPSDQEMAYPTAQPQQYAGKSTSEKGVLIVTSNVPDVRIAINTTNDEPEGPGNPYLPNNFTPFIDENIPAGYYSLIAEKTGYVYTAFTVLVEPNKTTRITIQMQQAQTVQ